MNRQLMTAMWYAKMKVKEFLTKEDGDTNVVMVVVLLGIAIMIALVFRQQIGEIIGNIFKGINEDIAGIQEDIVIPEGNV